MAQRHPFCRHRSPYSTAALYGCASVFALLCYASAGVLPHGKRSESITCSRGSLRAPLTCHAGGNVCPALTALEARNIFPSTHAYREPEMGQRRINFYLPPTPHRRFAGAHEFGLYWIRETIYQRISELPMRMHSCGTCGAE